MVYGFCKKRKIGIAKTTLRSADGKKYQRCVKYKFQGRIIAPLACIIVSEKSNIFDISVRINIHRL